MSQSNDQDNKPKTTNAENPANTKGKTTANKPNTRRRNAPKSAQPAQTPKATSTASDTKKTDTATATATSSTEKPTQSHSTNAPTMQKKDTDTTKATPKQEKTNTNNGDKKGGGLFAILALIAGITGTGIGLYNLDQIRQLSTNNQTTQVAEQLKSQFAAMEANVSRSTTALKESFTGQLQAITQSTEANKQQWLERLSAVEQTQNGLSKTLQGDLNATLDSRLDEVNALLQKVDQIELTQKSITQNLNQVAASGEALTAKGMAKQEVGYLLRMATYKIQSEGDVDGAAGLLKIAEDKLLLINEGKTDAMIEAIRQKAIQLRGVKPVDSNALISQLKKLSGRVANLTAKPAENTSEISTGADETTSGLMGSLTNLIASGVKYTPNDPSKIDISAETILIEKRLMQADIRTAELAVRSQNGVLLAETLNSIRSNLDTYFADNDAAKAIKATLDNIEQQKLETVLPNLAPLVDQFEQR